MVEWHILITLFKRNKKILKIVIFYQELNLKEEITVNNNNSKI
jgi:hypothetical protein